MEILIAFLISIGIFGSEPSSEEVSKYYSNSDNIETAGAASWDWDNNE